MMDFISYLRSTFNSNLISEKTETYLFNLVEYLSSDNRCLNNVNRAFGVIVDIDNGDLSPEDFRKIFETDIRYSCVMMNSFSRSKTQPNNYRVIFPIQGIVDDVSYRAIELYIQRILLSYGYITAKSKEDKIRILKNNPGAKFSGIDISKCHTASFFYVPCKVIGREEEAFFWTINISNQVQLTRYTIDPVKVLLYVKEEEELESIKYELDVIKEIDHKNILALLMSGNYCFEDHYSWGALAAAMYNSGFSKSDFAMITPFIMRTKNKSNKDIDAIWKGWIKYKDIKIGTLIYMLK